MPLRLLHAFRVVLHGDSARTGAEWSMPNQIICTVDKMVTERQIALPQPAPMIRKTLLTIGRLTAFRAEARAQV